MFEAEVARGAAWLDEHKPGWERLIDLTRLDMDDCEKCVLGQAFRDAVTEDWDGFTYAERQFRDLNPALMGFDRSTRFSTGSDAEAWTEWQREWAALGDAWGALIKDRFDKWELSDA